MFADYLIDGLLHRNPRPNCQRSTIPSGTRQSPTLVINLTKIGSTLSPEEHRLHAWAGPLSRDSKHKKFRQFVNENLEKSCVKISPVISRAAMTSVAGAR